MNAKSNIDHKLADLEVFVDPVARGGYSNMAMDELFLKSVGEVPRLRFYEWVRPEVSFGYFDGYEEVKEKFAQDEVSFVRRWTGGGVVDHREDLTYTLVLPRDNAWAKLRGSESYRLIHSYLVQALEKCGIQAKLIPVDSGNDSIACFENPVAWDVVDKVGNKLAGAGQKRSRFGLLHQGSVQGVEDLGGFRELFVRELALNAVGVDFLPRKDELLEVRGKYASEEWLEKR